MTDDVISAQGARRWTVQTQGRVILPGDSEIVAVPSGQDVTLTEVILDQPSPDAATYRFRFLAPAIARLTGTKDFAASVGDMQHLCDTYALHRLAKPLPATLQVIIAFSDIELPFGETNPEATQFFVAFSVRGSQCILEPF